MGWSDHLQNASQLHCAAGNVKLGHELGSVKNFSIPTTSDITFFQGLVFETAIACVLCYFPGLDYILHMYGLRWVENNKVKNNFFFNFSASLGGSLPFRSPYWFLFTMRCAATWFAASPMDGWNTRPTIEICETFIYGKKSNAIIQICLRCDIIYCSQCLNLMLYCIRSYHINHDIFSA